MFLRRTLAQCSMAILIALTIIPAALATEKPTLDPIPSPLDAPKAIIKGTTSPGFKVILTGGLYDIPPVTADANGRFEIQIALVQETENIFSLIAQDLQGVTSEAVELKIIEGAEAAAAAEASGGGDRTAPPAVVLNQQNTTVNANTFVLSGTGEAGASLMITGTKNRTIRIKNDGTFNLSFSLAQNAENIFDLTPKDDAGNVGPSVRLIVIEESPEGEEITTEEPSTQLPEDLSTNFKDVDSHWSKNYIAALVDRGVVNGYSDGTFRPDAPVTRAEFIKMVIRALGYMEPSTPESAPFLDVPTNAWYAHYVAFAKKSGFVTGYDDSTFHPDQKINRAEALKILFSAADVETEELGESGFNDVLKNDWFFRYIKKARELGIVNGYDDGRFNPNDSMTRGQVAKVIVLLLNQL